MARAVCPRCERPASTCLCAAMPAPVAVRTELLILQHPAEAGHAKSTAAFLTLGLSPAARLLRGEAFDAATWAGPGTALLYPGDGAAAPADTPSAAPTGPASSRRWRPACMRWRCWRAGRSASSRCGPLSMNLSASACRDGGD